MRGTILENFIAFILSFRINSLTILICNIFFRVYDSLLVIKHAKLWFYFAFFSLLSINVVPIRFTFTL